MAIGDAFYRITELETRLRHLENKTRSTVPGNAPSRGPDHPLAVVTSHGQAVPLADSDAASRALSTAVENALAAVESIQDVKTSLTAVNFGGGVTQTIRQTLITPEPVIGDVYMLRAGGFINNQSGGGRVITFSVITDGVTNPIATYILADTLEAVWWVNIALTCIVAGSSGQLVGISNFMSTDNVAGPVTNVPTAILPATCFLTVLNKAVNLVGPVAYGLQATSDAVSANLFINPTFYLVDRKAFRV